MRLEMAKDWKDSNNALCGRNRSSEQLSLKCWLKFINGNLTHFCFARLSLSSAVFEVIPIHRLRYRKRCIFCPVNKFCTRGKGLSCLSCLKHIHKRQAFAALSLPTSRDPSPVTAAHTNRFCAFCRFLPSLVDNHIHATPVAMVCYHRNKTPPIAPPTLTDHAVGRKGQERKPHARAAHPEARAEHLGRRVW